MKFVHPLILATTLSLFGSEAAAAKVTKAALAAR